MRELDSILARTGYQITHFQTEWGRAVRGDVRLVITPDCSVLRLRTNMSITGTGTRNMAKTTFAFNSGSNQIFWKNQPIDKYSLAGFNLKETRSHYRLEKGSVMVAVLFDRSNVIKKFDEQKWDDVFTTLEGCNHVRCDPDPFNQFKKKILSKLSKGLLSEPDADQSALLSAFNLIRTCRQKNHRLDTGTRHNRLMTVAVAVARLNNNQEGTWVVPDVKEFTRLCEYSNSAVAEACYELYGMPTKQLLTGIRMENAIQLLKRPVLRNKLGCGHTVKSVADFLQISTRALHESMLRYRGTTPRDVQKMVS